MMDVTIPHLIRDATYLSNKQRSSRWHPAFAKQGIKRAIAVNSVSLEVWTILVSFSILYQSVPKEWSSPSRTLYMISLGIYPSVFIEIQVLDRSNSRARVVLDRFVNRQSYDLPVIRRRLTWPLSRHLALYSKKLAEKEIHGLLAGVCSV